MKRISASFGNDFVVVVDCRGAYSPINDFVAAVVVSIVLVRVASFDSSVMSREPDKTDGIFGDSFEIHDDEDVIEIDVDITE